MHYHHIDELLARRIIIQVVLHDYSSREAGQIFHLSHRAILNILHKCDQYHPKYTEEVNEILERHKDPNYRTQ